MDDANAAELLHRLRGGSHRRGGGRVTSRTIIIDVGRKRLPSKADGDRGGQVISNGHRNISTDTIQIDNGRRLRSQSRRSGGSDGPVRSPSTPLPLYSSTLTPRNHHRCRHRGQRVALPTRTGASPTSPPARRGSRTRRAARRTVHIRSGRGGRLQRGWRGMTGGVRTILIFRWPGRTFRLGS